jgi:hypothetical protein
VLAWWLQRLSWVAGERCGFGDEPPSDWSLVTIIGREHYRERRKSYPIRSWRELSTVVALEGAADRPTLTYIGPWHDERREVTFFEINPAFVALAPRSLFWIPESALVVGALEAFEVATVEREGLRYFCSRAGASQLQGGLIRTAASYALGVGVPADDRMREINAEALKALLPHELQKLPWLSWVRSLRPGLSREVFEWMRPASIALAVSLIVYCGLASFYLIGAQAWRERQLTALGPAVGGLLQMQRRIESTAREAGVLSGVLQSKNSTYRVWEVAGVVWRGGGMLSGLQLLDREITLRGTTPVATDLLSALGKLPSFEGAKFGAPVRQAGNREEFTIVIRLKASAPEKPQ